MYACVRVCVYARMLGCVTCLAEWGVVLEDDDPIIRQAPRPCEVRLQPLVQPGVVFQAEAVRVDRHKVRGAVVERVVGLVIGGKAPRDAIGGVGEQRKVGPVLCPHVTRWTVYAMPGVSVGGLARSIYHFYVACSFACVSGRGNGRREGRVGLTVVAGSGKEGRTGEGLLHRRQEVRVVLVVLALIIREVAQA